MIRPEVIYLTDPIEINGIKIGHTQDGLEYLIDHYKILLTHKQSQENKQYMELLITNWEQHLQLYKKQNDRTTTGAESNS